MFKNCFSSHFSVSKCMKLFSFPCFVWLQRSPGTHNSCPLNCLSLAPLRIHSFSKSALDAYYRMPSTSKTMSRREGGIESLHWNALWMRLGKDIEGCQDGITYKLMWKTLRKEIVCVTVVFKILIQEILAQEKQVLLRQSHRCLRLTTCDESLGNIHDVDQCTHFLLVCPGGWNAQLTWFQDWCCVWPRNSQNHKVKQLVIWTLGLN